MLGLGRVRADPQEVAPGDQAEQCARGAVNDRRATDIGGNHAVGELGDSLVRVANELFAGCNALTQRHRATGTLP